LGMLLTFRKDFVHALVIRVKNVIGYKCDRKKHLCLSREPLCRP